LNAILELQPLKVPIFVVELLRSKQGRYLVLWEEEGGSEVAPVVVEVRGYGFKREVGPGVGGRDTFGGDGN
jgi:hypothetical protein